MPLVSESDKREIDGVEHQLDRHKHRDQIALDKEADNSKAKQHSAQEQIPGKRDFLLNDMEG